MPLPKKKKNVDPTLKGTSRSVEGATYISDAAYIKADGGMILSKHHAILPLGGFSDIQNLRPTRPGWERRSGCIELHSTADSTNKVVNLGCFSKGKKSEVHTYAQFSDGDVLEATANPPGVTVGAFGSEVYSTSTTGMLPASFTNILDRLIFCDGTGYPYMYGGSAEYVKQFVKYVSAAAIPVVPTLIGVDYTVEVTDDSTSTVADLSSLSVLTDYDAIFIRTDLPADAFTFTMVSLNTTASVMQVHYWNGAWAAVSGGSDGTSAGSCAFGQTGTVSWTATTDHVPHYMFGSVGYWYRISLASGALDAATTCATVTFESNWAAIQNMWNGEAQSCPEAFCYINADTNYQFYTGTEVALGALTSSDAVYVGFAEPAIALFFDIGDIPNTVAATMTIKYNANGTWTDTSATDGTINDSQTLAQNGWATFAHPANETPMIFHTSNLYQYWYQITFNATLTEDMVGIIQAMPYLNLNYFGKCFSACAWKGRAVYAFEKTPGYIAISTTHAPMQLYGTDFAFQEIGDGRENKVVSMRQFHSELMVWQEEKGVESGTCTLIQGYSPTTYGRYLISPRYGAFSHKATCVIEGIPIPTIFSGDTSGDASFAFWISRYGIIASDGRKAKPISGPIELYFDPRKPTTCIRKGYEYDHWIQYDSACGGIRVGLVTGTTATVPNTFLFCDLYSGNWSHDVLAQEFACCLEVEAGSGNLPVIQIAGGVDDGKVYLTNYGTNDNGTAIDSFITTELDAMGYPVHVREMFLRTGTVAATSIRSATYAWTLSTAAGSSGEYYCRLSAGTDPSLTDPVELHINGTPAPRGVISTLNPGEFAYGDADTLGYNTVYVRLGDSSDPDSQSAGYVATVPTGIVITPYINNVAQTHRHVSDAPEIANESLRRNRLDVNTTGEHVSLKIQSNILDHDFDILDLGLELLVYREQ